VAKIIRKFLLTVITGRFVEVTKVMQCWREYSLSLPVQKL